MRIHRLFVVSLMAGLAGSVACSAPDLSNPKSIDPSQLAWAISLSAHAITMSTVVPYNTVQLTAVARTMAGEPLTGTPAVTFTSTDSSVRVSSTGLVTARSAKTNVQVIATLLYQGLRLKDSATVNVTADTAPPTFHHLQLQVPPGDSTSIAAGNRLMEFLGYPKSKTLQVGALDASGLQIPNSMVALEVSDVLQGLLEFNNGKVSRVSITESTVDVNIPLTAKVGVPITVYASATVYGITRRDSLQLLITPQLILLYTVRKSLPPGSAIPIYTMEPQHHEVIGVGGSIWWWNNTSDSLDIVFDDPAAASPGIFDAETGNIAPFEGDSSSQLNFAAIRSRQFLQAGTFRFHSVKTGLSGTIVVQ